MVEYKDAPVPKFGDYSTLGIGAGEIVMIAGQLGADANGEYPADGAEQTRLAFENVGTALRAVGLGFEHVVGFRTYVVGRESIPEFVAGRREVYPRIYPSGVYPPNTLLMVCGLVSEAAKVEIEALAVRPTGS
jgi:enamine deaminase RidA (YjgF/YER057c/UK114 family)